MNTDKKPENVIKPVVLTEGSYTRSDLEKLVANNIWQLKDIYINQIKELFEINNAKFIGKPEFNDMLNEFVNQRASPNADLRGNYIYYPWSGIVLHTVNADDQKTLRLNRTHALVTNEEQKQLAQFTAGIAGLSFGNGIALSLVYSGIADSIKLADKDIFETTNLNRARVGLTNIGESKVVVTAREIYEINPYADVQIFNNGLTNDNINSFFNNQPKLDIIFDVVDDLAMKIKIRLAAKKFNIPVVMLTSLEDSILIDVERFDINPNAEILHGMLGSNIEELLTNDMSEQEKARYALIIVGEENVSYRNLLSLSNIGKTLVSRPHLYSTVSIVCGLAAHITKRIALGQDMPSMRKHVIFNEVLSVLSNSDDTTESRERMLSTLLKY